MEVLITKAPLLFNFLYHLSSLYKYASKSKKAKVYTLEQYRIELVGDKSDQY